MAERICAADMKARQGTDGVCLLSSASAPSLSLFAIRSRLHHSLHYLQLPTQPTLLQHSHLMLELSPSPSQAGTKPLGALLDLSTISGEPDEEPESYEYPFGSQDDIMPQGDSPAVGERINLFKDGPVGMGKLSGDHGPSLSIGD